MPVNKSEKLELIEKLNELLKKQSQFQQEINKLQITITQLKVQEANKIATSEDNISIDEQKEERKQPRSNESHLVEDQYSRRKTVLQSNFFKHTGIGSEIEHFIGTNLINKIGIIVVIIGVGIGSKYAIDSNLISPVMRIILGYLVGGILAFLALRLKKNYFNFSAVLFSGAITILYFISYAAYTYYNLYTHAVSFGLMVLFTAFTVGLALYYNRQVIAHFGLTGAYITPFLLADPDSSALVLFTYMVIINFGILFISTKKRWKPLNYVALLATWFIFLWWFKSDNYNNQLAVSLTFSTLFFAIFYLVFISYKLLLKEKFSWNDIFFLLFNSLVFYVVGLESISDYYNPNKFEGLFTFSNSIIHGAIAILIYKSETENKKLFLWTIGLVISLITIAIGIQFHQEVQLMIWSAEVALLFWLGRRNKIMLFDYISMALISFLLLGSIINWFSSVYNFNAPIIKEMYTPFISLTFLASLTVICAYSFVLYIHKKMTLDGSNNTNWMLVFSIYFPIIFLAVLFFTFFFEINLHWNNRQIFATYELIAEGYWGKAFEELNEDIFRFKSIWLVNYSLLFVSLLAFVNFRWIRHELLNAFIFVFGSILILVFMSSTLSNLSILRDSYLSSNPAENYDVNIFHLIIRYVTYMFLVLLFYSLYQFSISLFSAKSLTKAFEIILSISAVWICSSELIHWLSLSGSTEVYKHSLSILWGIISFILIGYGIWKKKKHLRLTSIILFSGTILKLFFYDLTHLETVPKTIVFISIGALLLAVSFMYNKYKDLIFGNDVNPQNKP